MDFRFVKHVRAWAVLAGAGLMTLATAPAQAQEPLVGSPKQVSVHSTPYAVTDQKAPTAKPVVAEKDVLVHMPASDAAAGCGSECGPTCCFNETYVSLIDSTVPFSHIRLRYDATFNLDRPDRAGFIWAKSGAFGGHGPVLPETKVTTNELNAYLEWACTSRFSLFGEVPFRVVNPNVNEDAEGIGDINFGVKVALLRGETGVATFQFRAFVPTGDARQGLGNDNFALEYGLLINRRIHGPWLFEGEVRYWDPTDDEYKEEDFFGNPNLGFAGNIWRVGGGISYNACNIRNVRIVPVGELVVWYLEDGRATVPPIVVGGTPVGPPVTPNRFEDVGGEKLINFNLGARVAAWENSDLYVGYGTALSSRTFYDHMFRLEFRMSY